MSRVSILKTIGRLAALGLLLLSSLGPWFADTHPATEATCTAPLVWVGNGHCACFVSLISFYEAAPNYVEWLGIPPLLPILFTSLLFLGRNHRILWYFHLTAWFLVAVYSLFFFIINLPLIKFLFLWGSGLCGTVAVLLLAWEILIARRSS